MCLIGPLIEYNQNICVWNCLWLLFYSLLLPCYLVNAVKDYFVVFVRLRSPEEELYNLKLCLTYTYISMCCVNVLGLEMCAAETTDIRFIRHSQMYIYYT
jgi:hypothetical protein